MRIVYMGSPDFAVKPLERLIADGHEIIGVFSQADKPKNRGMQLSQPPVKVCAITHNLPIFQPKSLKTEESYNLLKELNPDIIVVTAYGKLLPKSVLELPKYGCINVHASLLPLYRGASPIQQVIIRDESKTGVTIMQMDEGLDTGDILLAMETEISADETAETLHDKLADIGAEAVSQAIVYIGQGKIKAIKQTEDCPFYAPLIKKTDGFISFEMHARKIDCLARAMQPWPGTFADLNGLNLKVFGVRAHKCETKAEIGEIINCDKSGLHIACSDGIVDIAEIQAPGKKRISCEDYFRGHKNDLICKFK